MVLNLTQKHQRSTTKAKNSRKNYHGRNSPAQKRSTIFWSAVTCHRFGRSRPVATTVGLEALEGMGVKPPKNQSGDL